MRLTSIIILSSLLFVGCKKDTPIVCPEVSELENGMAVLCEGLFQQNNSSISWVDFADGNSNNQLFVNSTGVQLGDTGNDMKRYGSKIYIVVNVSSTVEVVSAKDFSHIKQISMLNGGTAKQPRSIAFYGSNAYVTCFDGFVDVIDTASLTVTQRIPVGANPEGLAVSGTNLYVANSGGLNFPNVDTTVSVVDLTSHSEITRINVGPNPGAVVADGSGDVYVVVRGDYGAIPSRLKRIDASANTLVESYNFDVTGMSLNGSTLYVYDAATVQSIDTNTDQVVNSNVLDLGSVTTMYGLKVHPSTGAFYVSDAMNYTNSGKLHQYSSNGVFTQTFSVGLNPSKIIFFD